MPDPNNIPRYYADVKEEEKQKSAEECESTSAAGEERPSKSMYETPFLPKGEPGRLEDIPEFLREKRRRKANKKPPSPYSSGGKEIKCARCKDRLRRTLLHDPPHRKAASILPDCAPPHRRTKTGSMSPPRIRVKARPAFASSRSSVAAWNPRNSVVSPYENRSPEPAATKRRNRKHPRMASFRPRPDETESGGASPALEKEFAERFPCFAGECSKDPRATDEGLMRKDGGDALDWAGSQLFWDVRRGSFGQERESGTVIREEELMLRPIDADSEELKRRIRRTIASIRTELGMSPRPERHNQTKENDVSVLTEECTRMFRARKSLISIFILAVERDVSSFDVIGKHI